MGNSSSWRFIITQGQEVNRGIHYLSYFRIENIYCGYSLEPPCRGVSNEHPQSMFWAEIWKKKQKKKTTEKKKKTEFLSENFQFFDGKIFNIFE